VRASHPSSPRSSPRHLPTSRGTSRNARTEGPAEASCRRTRRSSSARPGPRSSRTARTNRTPTERRRSSLRFSSQSSWSGVRPKRGTPVLHPPVELDRQRGVGEPAVRHLQQPSVDPQLHLRDERRQPERREGQPSVGLHPRLGASVGEFQSSHGSGDAGNVRLAGEHPADLLLGGQSAEQCGVDCGDCMHFRPGACYVDQGPRRRRHPVGAPDGHLVVWQCGTRHQPPPSAPPPLRIGEVYDLRRRLRPRKAPHPRGRGTAEDGGRSLQDGRDGEGVEAWPAPRALDFSQVVGAHEDAGAQPHPGAGPDRRPNLAFGHAAEGEVLGGEDAEPPAGRFGNGERDGELCGHCTTIGRHAGAEAARRRSVDRATPWVRGAARAAPPSVEPGRGPASRSTVRRRLPWVP